MTPETSFPWSGPAITPGIFSVNCSSIPVKKEPPGETFNITEPKEEKQR
jgi:hypothetical protein